MQGVTKNYSSAVTWITLAWITLAIWISTLSQNILLILVLYQINIKQLKITYCYRKYLLRNSFKIQIIKSDSSVIKKSSL